VAREFNVPRWYTEARQLVQDREVDLVSIATPPRTHAGYAALALGAGKHVVVEIAFVPAAQDARILLDVLRERKRIGAPAYILRYRPSVRLVTDLLAQNLIGQPRLMRADFFSNFLAGSEEDYRWLWDGDNGGGVLASYMTHTLDIALRWFGPVHEVSATLSTLSEVTIPAGVGTLGDDTGFVSLVFENGLLASFNYSAATAYTVARTELHGSLASLLIEDFGDNVMVQRMGEALPKSLYPPEAYLEETRGHGGTLGGFHVFLERLADGIAAGEPPADLPTFADGLEVTRLVEAIRVSQRERRSVRLSTIG
jgi:predicted dehydrogenase